MKLFIERRRRRWVDQVITNGRKLRQAEVARRGWDATQWPDECKQLDDQIDAMRDRRDRLLTRLRETA